MKLIRKITKKEEQAITSKDAAKERLHLVLMQDRANVSADFLELMKQEIIEVIKKYIDVDESAIDVRLTNKDNGDGTKGAPALYANIPIVNIKEEVKQNNNIKTQEDPHDTQEEAVEVKAEKKTRKVAKTKKEKEVTGEDKPLVQESEEIKESEEIIHEDQEKTTEEVVVQNVEN